jgi:hypothetical protein
MVLNTTDARVAYVDDSAGAHVATIRDTPSGVMIETCDDRVRAAIDELVERGRQFGLLLHEHRRRSTQSGVIYSHEGTRIKPGDAGFLDALADALVEFEMTAYTMEAES